MNLGQGNVKTFKSLALLLYWFALINSHFSKSSGILIDIPKLNLRQRLYFIKQQLSVS